MICKGEYEKAIEFLEKAATLFQNSGNKTDAWQCADQARKIRNRNQNHKLFIEYVQAVSGGYLNYPNNF